MAKFDSIVFTDLVNSIGNVTAFQRNGENYLRKKAYKVSNPRTLEQVLQRLRFVATVDLAARFASAAALGMVEKPARMSSRNCFVHLNKGMVRVSEEGEVLVDFEKLVVAKGNRFMPDEISVTHDAEEGTFTVSVGSEEEDEFVAYSASDDEFFCCVYEKVLKRCKVVRLGRRNELAPQVVPLPKKWSKEPGDLAFYVFCVSADKKQAGNSKYVAVE